MTDTNTPEFTPFPKLARLKRGMVITEKLDGTNAAVKIVRHDFGTNAVDYPDNERFAIIALDSELATLGHFESEWHVYAQSRNRYITPWDDNYGFATWVQRNAKALVEILGEGTHFGEWWGGGIQRAYGRKGELSKTFSLFNTARWDRDEVRDVVLGLDVVPVLHEGPFSTEAIDFIFDHLRTAGSQAAPGFANPEGIVIYLPAANQSFKMTYEHDGGKGTANRSEHDLLPSTN